MSSKTGIDLIRLPTQADAFMAIKSGRADAFLTARSTVNAPDFNILAKKIRPSSLQIPSETLKKAVSSFCSA